MKTRRFLLFWLGVALLAGGLFLATVTFEKETVSAAPSCVGCNYSVPYSISGDWPRSGSCLLRASSWMCYVGGTHIRALPFVTSCDWDTAPYPPSTPGYQPGYEYVTYIWCDSYVPAPSVSISASGPGTLYDGDTGTVRFSYYVSSPDTQYSWSVSTAVGSRSGSGASSGTISGGVGGRLPDNSPGTTQTYCGSVYAVNSHGGRSASDSDCTTVTIVPYSPTVAITPDKNPVKPGELVPITLTLNAGRDWYQATYTLRVLNASGQLASTNEVRSPQLSGSFQGAITARPQLIFGLPAAGKTYTLEVTVTNTHGKSARATRTISVVAPPTGGGGSGENSNQVLIIKPSIRITADEDARLIVAWKNLTNVKLSVTPCIPSPALPCGGALSLPDTPAGSYSGERTFDLPSTLWRQGGATFPQVYTFTVTGTDRVGATYSEKATLIIDEAPTRLSE